MSSTRPRGRRLAGVLITVATVLGIGGVAFAYFTATGSGTGSALTGSAVNETLSSAPITGVNPASGSQTILGSVSNTANANEYIGTVSVSISSVVENPTIQALYPTYTCSAADYTVSGHAVNQDVASGTSGLNFGTIAFNSTGVNQDACMNATINLSFTSS